MGEITWEDFDKVEMRVGRVVQVEHYPGARKPSYKFKIDFGPRLGVLRSVAALAQDYERSELIGRAIVAVTNFPPKQIGNHLSEVLILAAQNADGSLRLLEPDSGVELGARIR